MSEYVRMNSIHFMDGRRPRRLNEKERANTLQGDFTEDMMEQCRGGRLLARFYGVGVKKIKLQALKDTIRFLASIVGLTVDRDSGRRKILLVKWVDDNAAVIEQMLNVTNLRAQLSTDT